MKLAVHLARESPWERHRSPIVPVGRESHRPKKRFKVKLLTVEDAEAARRQGLPLILVQPDELKMLRYPLEFPPTIIVPREYEPLIDTDFRLHIFQSLGPFERPRIEDIVVFLLAYDLVAARAVVERNADLLDFEHLRKRILQEDLEAQATQVHLQDFMDFPRVGDPLPREPLLRAAAGNKVIDVVP